ncbi:hypothetical protein F4775DRAFT_599164 [Biscogniauxia sp. FL1348]|nr:hypothetical protein F4775DRAFT_599164 [Biscogniauxia sp. FL1348]
MENPSLAGPVGGDLKIPHSSLSYLLPGVAEAFKLSTDITEPVSKFFHSYTGAGETASAPSLPDWLAAIPAHIERETPRQVATITVAVAILRERCRQATDESTAGVLAADELNLVWDLIHNALTTPLVDSPLGHVNRSAQGFLTVPLCNLKKGNTIDELYRLHVWLPDGQRGNPDTPIHSHQSFAQSWVLAGEGVDSSYAVEPAAHPDVATHAEYGLQWSDGAALSRDYSPHFRHSVITNTGRLARAALAGSAAHTRGMAYSIPSARYHTSSVAPDAVHATLFFFDSRRGFFEGAGVLGPKNGGAYREDRAATAGVTAADLARTVSQVRRWELLMERADQHMERGEWEPALQNLHAALGLCGEEEEEGGEAGGLPNAASFRAKVVAKLESANQHPKLSAATMRQLHQLLEDARLRIARRG